MHQVRLLGLAALTLIAGAGSSLVACGPPAAIKTASGEALTGVTFEETFPLSNDGHETTFRGERLRRAVGLLDKHGVSALAGNFEAKGVLDRSTLVLTFALGDGKERKVVVKNCAETHVCAFFAEALQSGLAEKVPFVCREAVACATQR